MSKRLGTAALRDLRNMGIAQLAVLSLMARLGSSEPVELRSSIEEVINGFDVTKFGSAPTKFDFEDLWPLTARYNATLSAEDVADHLKDVPADKKLAFWDAIKSNITKLDDIADWWAFFENGAAPLVEDEDREFIAQAFDMLGDPPYADDTWSSWTTAVKEATGRKGKGLFMPLRKAVTGRERGPEMGDVMPLLQHKPKI